MEIINVHMLPGGDNESHISRCATVNIDVCDWVCPSNRPESCQCVVVPPPDCPPVNEPTR